ncbi:DUF2156 domain-containing protein [Anaerobium acetethylicum]|uniref:Phosphatidylglycerol lysyltransferase C-terminal domain-containing protein n=1 Tax=Anaerobium acetethylicum TaxID=1619234 RepID=A0A1D3TVW0_9FIRM|nr:phosphatidylglycerol lysyltransferase domain-containing protein [Anaerobium acetethylicum]SCP98321.1 hypothetical protein SAMN05421730_101929 [Anaerobium acetethylicum]
MDIEFRRPELEDKQLIEQYLHMKKMMGCEMTFGNIYLWSRHYGVTFAVINDMLVFKSSWGKNPSFVYPVGKGDVKAVIDTLEQYCAELGCKLHFHSVSEEQFAELDSLYPGKYEIEYMRDSADYVYELEKLVSLAGKKYHGKRNHINRFIENNNWSYEAITRHNLEDCFQMALMWRKENLCDDDEGKTAELCVTLNALRLFEELDFMGGLIRVDGEVIAFTIGEPLSDDTFVIHIEKAFSKIQGAYPMINQQFLQHACMNYKYVNREEDMGSEGLRKAKLSYQPVFLVQKGVVKVKHPISG